MKPQDIICRELDIGDHVVFHNNIYVVKGMMSEQARLKMRDPKYQQISIILMNPSKTTKPVKKYAGECCLIHKEDILAWKLKEDK